MEIFLFHLQVHFHSNQTQFQMKGLVRKLNHSINIRFETATQGNSEIAYWNLVTFVFVKENQSSRKETHRNKAANWPPKLKKKTEEKKRKTSCYALSRYAVTSLPVTLLRVLQTTALIVLQTSIHPNFRTEFNLVT